MGPAPSQPPSPAAAAAAAAAAESRVTKLPQDSRASHWRGRSQSERSAAVLGQELGDARTFPRHRRSTLLTHNHSGSHTHCPRDTQHRPPHTQPQWHSDIHTVPGTRRDTQHHTDTPNLNDTDTVPGHSTAQTHNHNDTQHYPNTITLTPSIAKKHAVLMT